MEKKTDRRINRTRRQLREALLALVLEKGFESVTIEEITDRADLGRTTFYLHYHDKEELLIESLGEMVTDLRNQIDALPFPAFRIVSQPDEDSPDPLNPIQLIFHHAAEHANLYRIILRGEGTSQVNRRMREFISDAVSEFTQTRSARARVPLQPSVPLVFFSNYIAGSLIGTITWWLEQDMPYPPQEIAAMYQKIMIEGAREALGLPYVPRNSVE
jgi:AcrR family transcriptional regulator